MTETGYAASRDIEALAAYYEEGIIGACPLEVSREVCLSLLLGRVGVALECPDQLAATRESFDAAKLQYAAAYREHAEESLRPLIQEAEVQGPLAILRGVSRAIREILDAEAATRYAIYTLHDMTTGPEDQEHPGKDHSNLAYARLRNAAMWLGTIRKSRGISADPGRLVALAGQHIETTTLSMLEGEEAHLLTRRKIGAVT